MTCATCLELTEELRRLRKVAALPILSSVLCIGATHARLVARMHAAAPGTFVQAYDLEQDLALNTMPHANTIRVHISRIRNAIGDDFIETKKGEGYRLTADGRRLVSHVLNGGHPADLDLEGETT